ncbi:MAG TPA: hypothetical protein VMV52_08335 [Candidatus Nanopelagicaceae bacterium]|nr:hypothetical protein [Candidatus Nanopelagicaceae bacterium]
MGIFKRIDSSGFVLTTGERALMRAEIAGGFALATTQALHLWTQNSKRIEWWQINRVSFDSQDLRLVIAGSDVANEIHLTVPSKIAEVIRERVTATILTSIIYLTPSRARAVISVRRRNRKGADETFVEIEWQGDPTPKAIAEADQRGQSLLKQALA